jgi:phosphoketolase
MPLTTETAEALRRYRHAANYLVAAQLYLRANCLLEEPLGPSTSRRGCLATAEPPHRLAQRADLQ